MAISLGKYTIKERLGGGGMAEVFRAVLTGPGGFEKQLAIKLILPQFSDDEEFVDMFIREATLAAALDHANIVRIHEFDQIGGRYYIAMELVDGKDLRAVLARARKLGRALKIGEAVLLSMEISRGLSFAHGELTPGAPVVIHRDISPHNVILSRAGEVKITDFGIAKLSSAASYTKTGVVKGKLAYMSPEQASGAKLDKRSDLFSLGCVMWEMLTGQRLFRAKNDMEALSKLKDAPISPPSSHNPDVPPELDRLVLSCLVRDRENRESSASNLYNHLEEIIRDLAMEDRATALAGLYRDLFGTDKIRKGTAVLSMSDLGPVIDLAKSDVDSVGEEPGDAGLDEKGTEPEGSLSGDVEPVTYRPIEAAGPDLDTVLDSMPLRQVSRKEAKTEEPREDEMDVEHNAGKGTRRALTIAFISVLVLSGIVFLGLKHAWFGGQDGWSKAGSLDIAEDGAAVVLSQDAGVRGLAKLGAEHASGMDEAGSKAGSNSAASTMEIGKHSDGVSALGEDARQADGRDGRNRDGGIPDSGDGGRTFQVVAHGDESTDADISRKKKAVGFLNLNAIPWAKVYLRKRSLGVTPIEHLPLSVGRHRLILVNSELKTRRSVVVVIRHNKSTTKLVDLR